MTVTDSDFFEIQQRLAQNPHFAYPYKLLAGAPRIVTGQVDSTGAINAGTGFTVNKTGTGVYDITFGTPFVAAPIVLASATTNNIVAVTASSTTGFTATAFSADRDFNFVAFGTA